MFVPMVMSYFSVRLVCLVGHRPKGRGDLPMELKPDVWQVASESPAGPVAQSLRSTGLTLSASEPIGAPKSA